MGRSLISFASKSFQLQADISPLWPKLPGIVARKFYILWGRNQQIAPKSEYYTRNLKPVLEERKESKDNIEL